MHLVVPDGDGANRSRWRTDPVWETIQRAHFQPDTSRAALTRLPRVRHDLTQVDAKLHGLPKLRAALSGEYLDTTATLGQELRAFADEMDEVDAKRGRDFAAEEREKAESMGKPVPVRTDHAVQLGRTARTTCDEMRCV